jgi:uncharacterized DUF497 family protein
MPIAATGRGLDCRHDVATLILECMRITFDPAKRAWTLQTRGLDFEDTQSVFDGPNFTFEDNRFDYPEIRFLTFGLLHGRLVVVVWTPEPNVAEGGARRVISMRKANGREQARYSQRLGEGGRHH